VHGSLEMLTKLKHKFHLHLTSLNNAIRHVSQSVYHWAYANIQRHQAITLVNRRSPYELAFRSILSMSGLSNLFFLISYCNLVQWNLP